jgi:hypothetical protein
MQVLIVGADRLGKIPDVLRGFGFDQVEHVCGRQCASQRCAPSLNKRTDLVVLLTDFLGHNVMKSYRGAAQTAGVPVVACRRSVCALHQALSDRFVPAGA